MMKIDNILIEISYFKFKTKYNLKILKLKLILQNQRVLIVAHSNLKNYYSLHDFFKKVGLSIKYCQ